MDIYELIDQLEAEFDTSKSFLWSKKSLVDIRRCGDLVSRLKRSLPTAISEATYMLAKKDKILEEAKQRAESIVKDATIKAQAILDENRIKEQAEAEAQEIVLNAQSKAEHFSDNAKCNVDKMLKSIEDYLLENLMIVRNNREELAGSLKKK